MTRNCSETLLQLELQEDLEALTHWCREWQLPLNQEKCAVLHLGSLNPRLQYYLNDVPINTCSSHSDLGVIVTENRSWSDHIISILNKAKRSLFMIQKAFNGCEPSTYAVLFKTYVRPILEFAGPVWCPVLNRDLALLEGIQRRATRLRLGFCDQVMKRGYLS
ncbi:uncharacterized protein LOC123314384 [Coccinella septempunctata]|uniref:uncharacterized protein LOC123314384 n=1 Tax=Coccinella septempunctata TaxID=41139 RepID=UPI001D099BE8|nr:uncharacterized protein LOC123314384 [Coccinella septempunctata]